MTGPVLATGLSFAQIALPGAAEGRYSAISAWGVSKGPGEKKPLSGLNLDFMWT